MRALFLLLFLISAAGAQSSGAAPFDLVSATDALLGKDRDRTHALRNFEAHWSPALIAPLLDALRVAETLPTGQSARARSEISALLAARTQQGFGEDLGAWFSWLWNQKISPHPSYARTKARLYRRIDPRFGRYFDQAKTTLVRLDEVRWGGVGQDGIPPLRRPHMVSAGESSALNDADIVFGLEINGEARAYPKRILAWHELVTDLVGGIEIAGVYCTLCGTMIAYESRTQQGRFDLGTSGFLYRSNKLMYDRRTQSLWSTLEGRPVIGPLARGDRIRLRSRPVVTTTWGAWRKRHPKTRVLPFETGHDRDYGEGVAYRNYFGHDRLMFEVPGVDRRLANKSEILGLKFDGGDARALAIETQLLRTQPLFADRLGATDFVVLTDSSGASRVYAAPSSPLVDWDQNRSATSADGTRWTLRESHLESAAGERRQRLAAHRAFWFGWRAAYPKTKLRRLHAPSPGRLGLPGLGTKDR